MCQKYIIFFLYVPDSPTKYTLTGIAQLYEHCYTQNFQCSSAGGIALLVSVLQKFDLYGL